MSGWIKLHRQITEHWVFQDPVKFKRWTLLLLEVNYKDGKFLLGNQLITVKAGQSTKSIRTWAEVFECSTRTVNKFFELLELDGMITRQILGKGKHSTTLVNITNYADYQCQEETLSTTLGTTLSTRKVTHKVPTIEESKEDNNNLSVNWDGLLSQFNSITGKKVVVFNQKAKTQFKARLKEGYTKNDIVQAIINCFNDSYHRETGHKYLTLEFISRPDKMEKYANVNPDFKPPKTAL